MDEMMENFREEGDSRDSIELREEGELRESIQLSRFQIANRPKKQKSKTYHPTSLPYIRDNYKAERLTWERETKKNGG